MRNVKWCDIYIGLDGNRYEAYLQRNESSPPRSRTNEFHGNNAATWHSFVLSEVTPKLRSTGVSVAPNPGSERCPVPENAAEDAIDRNIEKLLRSLKERGFQLVYIGIHPDHRQNKSLYRAFKAIGEIKVGILTVCCQPGKLERNGRLDAGYVANEALKFNLKLGGYNQKLDQTSNRAPLPVFKDHDTMFVGMDVTHPSPGVAVECPIRIRNRRQY